MKRFYGGLCCVTFAITSFAYLTVEHTLETQNTASVPSDSGLIKSSRPYNIFSIFTKKEKKATRLAVVVGKHCPPCRRMKLYTIPRLLAEGYDVWAVPVETWNKKNPKIKIDTWPTLVFLTEKNEVVRKEEGFRTVEQVKKYLHKVEKDK